MILLILVFSKVLFRHRWGCWDKSWDIRSYSGGCTGRLRSWAPGLQVHYKTGVHNVPYYPSPWGRKFICWGEYQFLKREREYHVCGKENYVEKSWGNITFPLMLRLLGRISGGEAGKEKEICRRKSRLKKWVWGRISSCMELYTPLLQNIVNEMYLLWH